MTMQRFAWQLFATLILLCVIDTESFGITRMWDGQGDGITWNDGENWDPDGIPQPEDSADIGDNGVLISPSHLFVIQNLEVGFAGELSLQGQLNATGGDIENNGAILVDNGVALGPAGLGLGAGVIEGGGEVVLGESITGSGGATISGPPTSAVTNVAGHTIRGEGQFAGNWINESLIRAEDADGNLAGTLRFTGQMTNNGVIRSSATGEITFATDMTSGATGRIIADDGTIHLNNARFIGGSFESENGGHFSSTGNSLKLSGVHLKGNLKMVNPGAAIGTLAVEGSFINDGTIELSPDEPGASIVFATNSTIGGTGEIVMHFGGLGAQVFSTAGNVGTFGAGQTIRGAGQIVGAIINEGIIAAQPLDTGILAFSGDNKTNNNVIRADANAIARIAGTTITQHATTGRIVANQGKVELGNAPFQAANVVGGKFQTVGAGTIEVTGAARIDGVTNEGVLNVQSARTLAIGGSGIVNNGTLTLQATIGTLGAATAQLRNGASLSGSGEMVLSPQLPNLINRILVPTDQTATNAAGHTIRGEGFINGFNNFGTFINNGTIAGTSAANDIEFLGGEVSGTGLLKNVRIGPNTTHSPGASTATVSIEGAYTVSGGGSQLHIEIAGTTPGTQFDRLVSADTANVITLGTGSSLRVTLADGYQPAVNDTFTIISTAGSLNGQFTHELMPENIPNAHIDWDVIYSAQTVQLKVLAISQLLGDYNMNGVVDTADYTVWRDNFGSAQSLPNDDTPGVDDDDYTRWKQKFGAVAGSGAGAHATSNLAVPEPAALGLVVGALLAFAVQRGLRSPRCAFYPNGGPPDHEY